MKAIRYSISTFFCPTLTFLFVFLIHDVAYPQTSNRELKNQELNFLYNKAVRYIENKQYSQAIETLENMNSIDKNFRDIRSKITLARKRLSEQILSERVRTEYVKGMAAYEASDWTNAILAFESILGVVPQYRDIAEKLEEAKTKLVQDTKNSLAMRYYQEGVQARDRNNLKEALEFFQKAQDLSPGYGNIGNFIAESRTQLEATTQDVQNSYAKAMALMQSEQWDAAIATLEDLQRIAPNYADVAEKLVEAKAHRLATAQRNASHTRGLDALSLSGMAVATLAVPLMGLFLFSPVFRARALAWRGNYGAAADIYENLLKQKPSRSGLYGKLANLYVLLNRKDKRAMQVYKMVMQLDLPTRQRPEIDLIMSQNALGERDLELVQSQTHSNEKSRFRQIPPAEHLEACMLAIDQFDAPALENALVRAGLDLSHPMLLNQVVMPMMYIIGQRWMLGTLRVEQEHLASATVRTFLGTLIESYTPAADAPRLVVTTPKGQLHELGALAASIVAASEGWQVVYLGPNLPAEEMAASVKKSLARAVALSMIWPVGDPDLDKELHKLRNYIGMSTEIIVGGRAVEGHHETLDEIGALRVRSENELLSFREVLEAVRRH